MSSCTAQRIALGVGSWHFISYYYYYSPVTVEAQCPQLLVSKVCPCHAIYAITHAHADIIPIYTQYCSTVMHSNSPLQILDQDGLDMEP